MRTLFVFAVLGAGLGAATVSRFAALLLFFWYAFFRPQEWVWFDLESWRLSFLLGGVLVVPSLLSGIMPTVMHPLTFGSLVFLAAGLAAQTNAIDPSLGWSSIGALARLLVVCMLAVTLISSRERFVLALTAVAGSFGFHAAKAGLASILHGGLQFNEGVGGAFSDNNGFGVGAAMILFLLVALAQNMPRRWLRHGFYAAAALTVVTVVSTFSRGAFLAVSASMLMFLLLQRRRLTALCILAVVAAIGSMYAPIPEHYYDRVETITNYDQIDDQSALGRLHFWQVAMRMVEDHPLGIGLGNYEAAYDGYDTSHGQFGSHRAVHSSHFQVLAEAGYVGAVAWLGLFAYALFAAFRMRRRASRAGMSTDERHLLFTVANGLICSMTAFLVGGAFVALAFNDMTWVIFALVASLDCLSREWCRARIEMPEPFTAAVPESARASLA